MEADALLIDKNENNENKNLEKKYQFDEAIELAGDGIYQLRIFILFGLSICCKTLEATNLAYALPIAQCDIQMTMKQQGLANSSVFIGFIGTTYLWGFISDTWGRRYVLLIAYVMTFLSCSLSSLSTSIIMIMVIRFFVGVRISSIQPSITAYFGEFHSNKNRGKWISNINIFTTSAFVIQPVLSLALISMGIDISLFNGLFVLKPWRIFLLICSFIPLICFAILWTLPESPKFLINQGKVKETLKILNEIYRVNNKNDKYPVKFILPLNEVETCNNATSATSCFEYMGLLWRQTKALFKPPHLFNMAILCVITFLFYLGGFGLLLWFPQLVSIYQRNMDSSLTVCEVFSLSSVNTIAVSNSTLSRTQIMSTTLAPIQPVTPVFEAIKIACKTSVNSFTFQISLAVELLFLLVHSVISASIQKFGSTYVLPITFVTGAGSLLVLTWTRSFYLNVLLFKFLTVSTTCCTVLYTISSDLIPTQFKSMEISIMVLVGRTGAIFGSNFVGPMLLANCSAFLYTYASIIICCAFGAFYMLRRLEKYYKKQTLSNIETIT